MNRAAALCRTTLAGLAAVAVVVTALTAVADHAFLRRADAAEAQAQAPARAPAQAQLPLPGDPQAELIGLLEIPGVLDQERGADAPPTLPPRRPLSVYDSPADDREVVARIEGVAQLATREYAYEKKGAIVAERRPGWFRIGLKGGRFGWVQAADVGVFRPVTELLPGRHSYLLTSLWDGWVWPAPGAGYPVQVERRLATREQPVKIVGTEYIGGSLWLRLEVLSGSPCSEEPVNTTAAGYVPAYTAAGKLIAWFYSRGC